ncbi:UNVERIFIED_CONTAM: hypothetical protein GTU68_001240 [Idotea baltica]|nr:hypothetical protein [Idotea baltica]
MSFIVVGVNYKTASVSVRERIAFSTESLEDSLRLVVGKNLSREVAILSTCNRTEIYLEKDSIDTEQLIDWLAQQNQFSKEQLESCAYSYHGVEAITHIMSVASGLDSMVLGEPQILGQMKTAFQYAQKAGTLGPSLNRLFQSVFSAAKQVRTDTAIGENPVSVAFAVVRLAQQIFSNLANSQALLIGAGETIRLVASHLKQQGIQRIIIANRSLINAKKIADDINGIAIELKDISQFLGLSDIVISSTASQLPILGKGAIEKALKERKHKPMFLVDIAVPRDIEPEAGELEDVYLYTVDDLNNVISENVKAREEAALAARAVILKNVDEFILHQKELVAVDALKQYRLQAEQIRDIEVEKALRSLKKQESIDDVLVALARNLTNKLLHTPSVQLKRMAAEGQTGAVAMAQELFALEPHPTKDKGL